MTAAQLRVRTGVRMAFWTTVLLAAYIAAHAAPAFLAEAILSLFP